jgi:hypothetical protein
LRWRWQHRENIAAVICLGGRLMMIEGSFEPRIQANMDVALERVCGKSPYGERHDVRKRVAKAILQCAKSGKTALGALTEAGERALWRVPNKVA